MGLIKTGLLCLLALGLLGIAFAADVEAKSTENDSNELSKRSALACDATKCSGSCIYCADAREYFCAPSSSYICCGCGNGWNGFQCAGCPSYATCRYDLSQKTYYSCDTRSSGGGLSAVGIAMIVMGSVFFVICIVVICSCIRRRYSYATVEYTPSYGATVTTTAAPYPYYAPGPVYVEPAPIIVTDYGYHHHHHHHGHSFGAAGLYDTGGAGGGSFGAPGLGNTGGDSSAAVGFTST